MVCFDMPKVQPIFEKKALTITKKETKKDLKRHHKKKEIKQ